MMQLSLKPKKKFDLILCFGVIQFEKNRSKLLIIFTRILIKMDS